MNDEVLLTLTQRDIYTLLGNCLEIETQLRYRTDKLGIDFYNKNKVVKNKLSNIMQELEHKKYCELEIERVYGDTFVSCDFRTETPYKSKNNNMIYAYRVYYRDINQETYESELKAVTCEVEIIPVTTDEYGEQLEDTVDVDYMYEIIEDGE